MGKGSKDARLVKAQLALLIHPALGCRLYVWVCVCVCVTRLKRFPGCRAGN